MNTYVSTCTIYYNVILRVTTILGQKVLSLAKLFYCHMYFFYITFIIIIKREPWFNDFIVDFLLLILLNIIIASLILVACIF